MTGADPFSPPPGLPLREAHAHLLLHARSMSMLSLDGCASSEEMLDRLSDHMRADAGAGVVIANRARPDAWPEQRWPALAELDRVTDPTPCCCWCFDIHSLMVNSAMLALAGIGANTADPPGGTIGRDDTGGLTGVLHESAAYAAWDALPEPTGERRDAMIAAAISDIARHGFTEIHEMASQPWLGPAIARAGDPGVRVVLHPLLDDLDETVATRGRWESDRVRLGGGKVFADGTLAGRTAWMLEPYADGDPDHPAGQAMMGPGQLEAAVRRCEEHGVGLAIHAIGDAAVRASLDAVERVGQGLPEGRRHRVEHAELVHPDDVPRFAGLGVVCSVQPCHLLADIEALRSAVPDRLPRVLPLRDLIDAGCEPGALLVFGSDTPVVRPDPSDSIRAAVQRRRADQQPDMAIAPEQAIRLPEAIACFGGAD